MTPLEKVARAIKRRQTNNTGNADYWLCPEDDSIDDLCDQLARAAIEALMEPSEEMREIGAKQWNKGTEAVFRAMLTKALEEKGD